MKIKIGQKVIDLLRKKQNKKETNNIYILSTSGKIGKENFPICLSDHERQFLVEHIQNASNYLEFGAGGSTYLALTQTNIPNIVSVESDLNWIKHLEKWNVISSNKERLTFIHVNIGKTGAWGAPIEEDKKELYPNFSAIPFQNSTSYDVVFIDGRFRVACALSAIMAHIPPSKILIHDFSIRSEYHCILDFLDIVDIADTLTLFKVKEHYNKKLLLQTYNKYKYISA